VTTYMTYHGTHYGAFLGVAPTGRKIHFETVDVMRVRNGKCIGETGMSAPGPGLPSRRGVVAKAIALTAPTSMALMCRWRSRPQHHLRTYTRGRPPYSRPLSCLRDN
jgi:SnoaL-like polyketide cyclase